MSNRAAQQNLRPGNAVQPPRVSSKDFKEAFKRLQARKPEQYPDCRTVMRRRFLP